jgi:hypothetical protein
VTKSWPPSEFFIKFQKINAIIMDTQPLSSKMTRFLYLKIPGQVKNGPVVLQCSERVTHAISLDTIMSGAMT